MECKRIGKPFQSNMLCKTKRDLKLREITEAEKGIHQLEALCGPRRKYSRITLHESHHVLLKMKL